LAFAWLDQANQMIILPMKYLIALASLALPAMLTAKALCPMAQTAWQQTSAEYSLTSGWQGSPIITDRIL
jgi:hypothetical protein